MPFKVQCKLVSILRVIPSDFHAISTTISGTPSPIMVKNLRAVSAMAYF